MRMMHIGGPLHGDFVYVEIPPVLSFAYQVNEGAGRLPMWRRFQPEPGEPTHYVARHEVLYRLVNVPEGHPIGMLIGLGVSQTMVYGLASLSEAQVLTGLARGTP